MACAQDEDVLEEIPAQVGGPGPCAERRVVERRKNR